ncbi:lysoplasmalogenase [Cupriavidus gilardii]|uniref:lysoplasmalogenase n=1 Tax=Cupriavidus gilardii TaxID=82541 RepID=UPI0007E3821F|nr:lysoplasmalogenase [Cupriavidus gilardii]
MPPRVREWWMAGAVAGTIYGALLLSAALELPPGTPLTGSFAWQPAWKTAMALLLARAAWFHPVRRERRWLVAALLFSAVGDLLLAVPWLPLSFSGGLGFFLLAHLCYLALLLPLVGDDRPHRLLACGAVIGTVGTLLGRFWPNLGTLRVEVCAYVVALTAMACAAMLARLPTPLAALGALCFVVSDALIGIARFLSPFDRFELGIWWTYAAAQVLLVAGIVAGRRP